MKVMLLLCSAISRTSQRKREREKKRKWTILYPECSFLERVWVLLYPAALRWQTKHFHAASTDMGSKSRIDFQENWELKKHAQSIVVLERACAASWICFYRHIKVIAHEAISSRSSEILGYERLPVSGTGHGMMSVQTLTLHDRFPWANELLTRGGAQVSFFRFAIECGSCCLGFWRDDMEYHPMTSFIRILCDYAIVFIDVLLVFSSSYNDKARARLPGMVRKHGCIFNCLRVFKRRWVTMIMMVTYIYIVLDVSSSWGCPNDCPLKQKLTSCTIPVYIYIRREANCFASQAGDCLKVQPTNIQ